MARLRNPSKPKPPLERLHNLIKGRNSLTPSKVEQAIQDVLDPAIPNSHHNLLQDTARSLATDPQLKSARNISVVMKVLGSKMSPKDWADLNQELPSMQGFVSKKRNPHAEADVALDELFPEDSNWGFPKEFDARKMASSWKNTYRAMVRKARSYYGNDSILWTTSKGIFPTCMAKLNNQSLSQKLITLARDELNIRCEKLGFRQMAPNSEPLQGIRIDHDMPKETDRIEEQTQQKHTQTELENTKHDDHDKSLQKDENDLRFDHDKSLHQDENDNQDHDDHAESFRQDEDDLNHDHDKALQRDESNLHHGHDESLEQDEIKLRHDHDEIESHDHDEIESLDHDESLEQDEIELHDHDGSLQQGENVLHNSPALPVTSMPKPPAQERLSTILEESVESPTVVRPPISKRSDIQIIVQSKRRESEILGGSNQMTPPFKKIRLDSILSTPSTSYSLENARGFSGQDLSALDDSTSFVLPIPERDQDALPSPSEPSMISRLRSSFKIPRSSDGIELLREDEFDESIRLETKEVISPQSASEELRLTSTDIWTFCSKLFKDHSRQHLMDPLWFRLQPKYRRLGHIPRIETYDRVFLPTFDHDHWTLLVMDYATHKISFYDPLPNSSRFDRAKLAAKAFVQDDPLFHKFSLDKLIGPRQVDGVSCGYYVCKMIQLLLENNPIPASFHDRTLIETIRTEIESLPAQIDGPSDAVVGKRRRSDSSPLAASSARAMARSRRTNGTGDMSAYPWGSEDNPEDAMKAVTAANESVLNSAPQWLAQTEEQIRQHKERSNDLTKQIAKLQEELAQEKKLAKEAKQKKEHIERMIAASKAFVSTIRDVKEMTSVGTSSG